jgi:hypothetical protein
MTPQARPDLGATARPCSRSLARSQGSGVDPSFHPARTSGIRRQAGGRPGSAGRVFRQARPGPSRHPQTRGHAAARLQAQPARPRDEGHPARKRGAASDRKRQAKPGARRTARRRAASDEAGPKASPRTTGLGSFEQAPEIRHDSDEVERDRTRARNRPCPGRVLAQGQRPAPAPKAARYQPAARFGKRPARPGESTSTDRSTVVVYGRQRRRSRRNGEPGPSYRSEIAGRGLHADRARFSRSAQGPHLLREGRCPVGSAGRVFPVRGKAIKPGKTRAPRFGLPKRAGFGRWASAGSGPTEDTRAPRRRRVGRTVGCSGRKPSHGKAQGSIGRSYGGNTGWAQRIRQWSKALRSRAATRTGKGGPPLREQPGPRRNRRPTTRGHRPW